MSLTIVARDYLWLFAHSFRFLMVAAGLGLIWPQLLTKNFLPQEFRLAFGDLNLAVLLNGYEANLRMRIAV